MQEVYESPISRIIRCESEGVVCRSVGNESVGEEEGNGGFTYFEML